MRILIDTSFVVALINKNDEYHDLALQLSREFNKVPTVITDSVLLEIGNSLAKNHKEDAIRTIERFFDADEVEIIKLDDDLFEKGFALYKERLDKDWGLVDCISFVVMKERDITLALTHDRHFTQAGFRAMMREWVN